MRGARLIFQRRRRFAIYLCVTLVTLILLSASGLGDWGVAHGQTAPGRHPGARAAEATPGPPGAGGASGADRLAGALASPTISPTTVVGFGLIVAGMAFMLVGVVRKYRRRRFGPMATASSGASASAGAKVDD